MSCEANMTGTPIQPENGRERIEKLKKLTSERLNRTLKTKICNYFSARVQDVKYRRTDEMNYSVPKQVKSGWFGRLKSKLNNYSTEVKVLFNF